MSAEEEEEEEATIRLAMATGQAAVAMFADYQSQQQEKKQKVDHRLLPRGEKTVWDHGVALKSIRRDYLGSEDGGKPPHHPEKGFIMMFRISRARFDRMVIDFKNCDNSFYQNSVDACGKQGASLEAKLLLPLKTLAYGDPPHCFSDYFQMSTTLAGLCCLIFNETLTKMYKGEYLRIPTTDDLISLRKSHKAIHQVDGMFGSLDCMHTHWKNCPVAWQGSYKGKEKKSTIVLEAISDYHCFRLHAAYGFAGTMNDINILNLSLYWKVL